MTPTNIAVPLRIVIWPRRLVYSGWAETDFRCAVCNRPMVVGQEIVEAAPHYLPRLWSDKRGTAGSRAHWAHDPCWEEQYRHEQTTPGLRSLCGIDPLPKG